MNEKRFIPEIGSKCEMQDDHGRWVVVDIIAKVDMYIVGWRSFDKKVFYSNNLNEFRALKTEAEKSKQDQILKLTHKIYNSFPQIDGLSNLRAEYMAEIIYNAGFRDFDHLSNQLIKEIQANAVLRFGDEVKTIADNAYQDGVIQSAVAVHDVGVLCKYWADKTLDGDK